MERLWSFGLVVVLSWGAYACGGQAAEFADSGEGAPAAGGTGSGGTGGGPDDGGGTTTTPSGQGSGAVSAGTLTAGAWDDNRNFDFFLEYLLREQTQPTGALPFELDEHESANAEHALPPGPRETLDVALVLDTTGSMGDEMKYLKTEFLALSRSIEALHPDADQRWSLVVYKDEGDEYVVRRFDFGSDPEAYQLTLAAQSSSGGGDFPEAPDQGIAAANQLGWRTDDATARLLFWVADAPHHAVNARAMANAIRGAADMRVHVYPVASSGIDELTERSMRSAAQLTGGRYLFLTDDSGVGGTHKEPTVPCYFVTKLNAAILRMIDIELSGSYYEPDTAEIIRTGGSPTSGACQLESGEQVQPY
jgi:hypothetical protein